MKRMNTCFSVALALLLNSTFAISQDSIWSDANVSAKLSDQFGLAHLFDADDQALRSKLSRVPNELRGTSDTIQLPMPDGKLAEFSIVESSVMEDELAEEFPQIKSYKVYGIDDPSASGRVDMSPKGFRGMLMTSQGRVFIDPDSNGANASRYTSGFRTGRYGATGEPFQCEVHTLPEYKNKVATNFSQSKTVNRISGSLISYRLAVSATSEYVTAVGGTLVTAMAEINTAINRVNQIYERDLGIRLNLVGNNSSIVEVAPADFGFSDNDAFAIISQNQTVVDANIGSANYDIGHVFTTGGGGLAGLGVVCGSRKAEGVTGLPNPTGDGFYIDYVAHEIGHQFGGNHTFNGGTGSCSGGNRNASTAFEPGSGSTILGYAGICGAENIASASDATFHAGTISEINTFVSNGGASCAVTSVITPANSDPTNIEAGVDRVIPQGTPFQLVASAVDAGDTLSYQWDQMDAGTAATSSSTIGTDQGNNPLFRSLDPQTTGVRDFPALRSQLDGTTALGETLPTTARTLNFRVTVRDGKGGQGIDDVAITVNTASGPFAVTSHNTASTFAATDGATVTWNVANTTAGPVSCANVDIELFTFSLDGTTYGATSLLSATPNDGTQVVTIPDMSNAQARFSVSCSNNIFYDLSNADLNITGAGVFPTTGGSTPTPPSDTTPDAFTFIDVSGVATSSVQTSNTITVSGIDAQSALSVSGGSYSINSGAFTTNAGAVVNGDTVQVRHTASAQGLTVTDTTLIIGGVSDVFTSTTTTSPTSDTTPDAFTFTDVTGVATSSVQTSNAITVSGIDAQSAITVSSGSYSVNSGAFITSAGALVNGDTVRVRHTASAQGSTTTDTTLTIGGVSDVFTSTTAAAPPTTPTPTVGGGSGAADMLMLGSLFGMLLIIHLTTAFRWPKVLRQLVKK